MNKEQQIIEIIEGVLNVEKGIININTRIEDIEQWDSLTHVIIIGELQEKLGINIPLDVAIDLDSVKQIVEYGNK